MLGPYIPPPVVTQRTERILYSTWRLNGNKHPGGMVDETDPLARWGHIRNFFQTPRCEKGQGFDVPLSRAETNIGEFASLPTEDTRFLLFCDISGPHWGPILADVFSDLLQNIHFWCLPSEHGAPIPIGPAGHLLASYAPPADPLHPRPTRHWQTETPLPEGGVNRFVTLKRGGTIQATVGTEDPRTIGCRIRVTLLW